MPDQFHFRLKELIGERSVSDFARKVGLGESLIRKYLKGSEPSLSRAHQIAEAMECSLEWLASGKGHPYREADVVDLEALQTAHRLISSEPGLKKVDLPDDDTLTRMIAVYQYLRATKLRDGEFDEVLARSFARFLKNEQNLEAYKAKGIR